MQHNAHIATWTMWKQKIAGAKAAAEAAAEAGITKEMLLSLFKYLDQMK